ncbi:MAG: FKBP-type peptidyl-prolyl cis-trans isomerase [Bacteroidetes bacterium]|uniref:Peptidyl-prolyl cis-trans isomerase n=1 Tax=Candidatus Gallipaludibacter merdavium TaxID=2840839 RepID=A0A9D9N4X9_9BACT|nr:FKBP-type peptidyl-prolyl cis-trans isomerase [Candidatus Gallipaludibacter merdavium]
MIDAKPRKRTKKETKSESSVLLTNSTDSAAYCLGVVLGADLQNMVKNFPGDSINPHLLMQAMQKAFLGDSTAISLTDGQNYLRAYTQAVQEAEAAKRKQEQTTFLTENAKRPEVVSLPSGLQYEVLIPADGPKPTENSTVTVHYEGRLTDGTKFDSSYDRKEPATFQLTRVIKGWTEGVQLMSAGAKYKFYVPYTLGYGERGAGGKIPPYSTLIFTIELIEFK